MEEVIAHIEDIIRILQKEIRSWWIWVVLITCAGGVIIIYGWIHRAAAPTLLSSVAGSLVVAAASFPFKNIPPRRERIVSYARLKRMLETTPFSEAELKEILKTWTEETLKVTIQRGPNA